MQALIEKSATECVELRRRREISATDLVQASIARIEAVDSAVNALPIRCFEQALTRARALDQGAATDSVLHGLPIAVKDYNDVAGVRTTYGSPLFAEHVAQRSDATVQTLQESGAIVIAKSNVPEWAGGHTFNPVHGATRNPWDRSRSAGGSSGGSAAALASGQVWLATGNDLGGSLRTPAAFNAVVGLRPSPGRVPRGRRLQCFDTLWVEGPMARNVADTALMLDAECGAHLDDPLAFDSRPQRPFAESLADHHAPVRVAYSNDLGIVPMAQEIAELCERAALRFNDMGTEVTDECPDFNGVRDAFQTLRALLLATMMGPLLAAHRDDIAPEIVGNVERGLALDRHEIFHAERVRWHLAHRISDFFDTHDVLLCPSASIPPFPIEQRYVTEIDGAPCETYIDWFAITFALTMTACPVLTLPCGFTREGLPVGLQLMGKPRGEAALLAAASRLESLLGIAPRLPIDPR